MSQKVSQRKLKTRFNLMILKYIEISYPKLENVVKY